jgi:Trp operon repressor
MNSSNNILKIEIDKVLDDILNAYEQSGKKTSGQFEEGLDAQYNGDKVELFGYAYLAGRPKGKMPPVEAIEKWVQLKGITALEKNMTTSSLAWAIAKKIAREGTADESHLPIYEMILTPERIDDIIQKVSEFHAQLFVEEITTRLIAISQNYVK